MTHKTYIYLRHDVIDGQLWQATCACSWEGPPRTNEHMARIDKDDHHEGENT